MAYGHEYGELSNTNKQVLDLSDVDNKKNEQLIEFEAVDNTPFTVVKQNDEWFVLMGKYLIDKEGVLDKEEAINKAKEINWDKILKVVSVLIEELKEN